MNIDWQTVVAGVLVVGCAGHALRSLLPRTWRFGKRKDAPTAIGACGGCSGCGAGAGDGAEPSAAGPINESVIRIVRRPSRPDAAG